MEKYLIVITIQKTSLVSPLFICHVQSVWIGDRYLNGSLADPEKQAHRKVLCRYVRELGKGSRIKAGFLQVLGPKQQHLGTEGGSFTEVKIHLRPYRLNS